MKKQGFTVAQKIGIAALGLVGITIFAVFLAKKAEELRLKRQREKNEKLESDLVEGFSIPGIGNFPDPPSINDIGNKISDKLKGPIDSVKDGLNVVKNAILGPIEQILKDIEMFFTGFPNLGKGIFNHMMCGAKEAKIGSDYSNSILAIILECAWDKNVKFWDGTCTKYYFVDMFFGIFHGIFIDLPLLIIYAITGIDLQFVVDLIVEVIILPIDSIIFGISGYHIIRWPDSVVKNCYRCTGTMDFGDGKGRRTVDKTMGEWGSMLDCTIHQFIHGVSKIFTSIVPGPKWGVWFTGNHLGGGDDYPTYL
jgi:hypothetical protein